MSHLLGLILTLLSVCTISKALPDFHKQMSPQQLQSVFHVDTLAAVPHYEVVQLLQHHEPAAQPTFQRRRRRSINVVPAEANILSASLKDAHHVKKDLSKNPYYSELKTHSATTTNSVDAVSAAKLSKEHKVSFNAFGENLNLTLRHTEGLFKDGPQKMRMWTVRSEPNATHGLDMQEVFDEEPQSSEHIGELYQDEANLAAILMRRHMETGDLIMEGSIGHQMVIKPLPQELSPEKDQTHHVIYKRDTTSSDHLSDFAFMEPDDLVISEKLERLQKQRKRRSAAATTLLDELTDELAVDIDDSDVMSNKRSKRQAPYIIYPEVLVIVDYDGYRLHGGDNLQVKRYFISFWNGVDLRYRLLKGPRIRISIAGIIISRGRDATPYLERNRVGRDAIDSAAALTDMGKYLFRERRLPVYDIAVAITKYDMCRRRKGGRCTKGTAGFAYVGGACVVNKRLEKVNSVAIIEDTGGFSGIIVAAHEVGHLLGAVHDGSPPPSYLGGPGAQRCRWEDGYIMSDLRHTERGFRWSPCTVQSFHHFLNGDTATCLHNAPHEDSALGRSLPGTLLSLDAQCRRDRGTYACFKDQRVCAQLFCFDAQTGYCVAYRPAAEGSSCGNGMHCLDGRCTPQASNAIPNYGQQYRLAYNSADDAKSNENIEKSSEEENNDDDEDTEIEGETDGEEQDDESGEEEQKNEVQNVKKKIDSSVEETSLEITDEEPINLTTYTTTTTMKPYTTIQQQKTNTFEYLARILENNEDWQQYLKPPSTTTTITTTLATPITTTTTQTNALQQHDIIIKTSTSSSVSSSSSSRNSSKNSSGTIENSSNISSNEIQQQQQHTQEQQHPIVHTQQKHQQHQQQQPQQQQNILKLYSTEFRKQFQYYLNILQKNNSLYLNRNKQQLEVQKKTKQKSSQTQNSNYSVTNSDSNNGNPDKSAVNHPISNNTADDDEDDEESNEAIDKRKRTGGIDVTITTSMHQGQQLPTTITATTLAPPTRSYIFGGRSTPRSHSFFDTYFRKLQAINASQQQPPTSVTATFSTSTATSTTSSSSSSSSSSSTATQNKKQQQQQQQQGINNDDNFAGHFLKRTLSSNKNSSRNSSSNSSKYKNIKQKSSITSSTTKAVVNKLDATTTTTQQPAYATNYLGDNTNNLPAVVATTAVEQQQQQLSQLQQEQQSSSQQQQQPHPSQQQLKTQKLTRRQFLRTQIK